jgi:hypothetical protein
MIVFILSCLIVDPHAPEDNFDFTPRVFYSSEEAFKMKDGYEDEDWDGGWKYKYTCVVEETYEEEAMPEEKK